MKLGKYIAVDSVTYPNPTKFQIKYSNNEAVNLSEAFTELVSVNRLCKFGFDASFQLTSAWYNRILNDCRKTSVSCEVGGISYRGRLRIKDASLEKNSENTAGTAGLWTVKVSFTEF